MNGFGEGIAALVRFSMWFVPIAGILAAWKLIDIGVWIFHHVSLHYN